MARRGRFACVALMSCISLLVGCAGPTRDPAFARVSPPPAPPAAPANGTIYSPVSYRMALFEDLKARRVGDILTIKLIERTDATKSAETNVDKDTDIDIENPVLFGVSPSFQVGSETVTLESNLNSSKSFQGQGDSTQSNSLLGDITVTVAEVLSNGDLAVQGEKVFTLNSGHEQIRFSGVVRLADIDADNSVLSTRVANATIIYAGEGEVADASKSGWLTRFFTSVFFPF
jgi:flagellar L-ring protein precursor FlgH